jgi:hypothetical protein
MDRVGVAHASRSTQKNWPAQWPAMFFVAGTRRSAELLVAACFEPPLNGCPLLPASISR